MVPLLVNVCAIVLPLPFDAPVTPDCETVHAKDVLATLEVSAMELAMPEQMVCADGVAVAVGTGLTFTVTLKVFPLQLFAVGVTV